MPTYQYACTACDEQLEVVQSFSDASLTECPACSGRLRKKYGAVGVVFKGSGFYKNDSRAGAKGEGGASGSSSEGKGASEGAAAKKDTAASTSSSGSSSTPASSSGSSSSASTSSSSGSSAA